MSADSSFVQLNVRCIELSTVQPPKIHVCNPITLVDGKSEAIRLTRDGVFLLVDEDARMKRPRPGPSAIIRGTRVNSAASRDGFETVIYGPCALVRVDGENFVDLTDEDIARACTWVTAVAWRIGK